MALQEKRDDEIKKEVLNKPVELIDQIENDLEDVELYANGVIMHCW